MSGARKVAFIGSSSFSGSTAMDLIVGTSEGAISLGEIGKVFYPRQEIHSQENVDPEHLTSLDGILGRSEKEFTSGYSRIMTLHYDDSTDPFGLGRSEELEENGIDVISCCGTSNKVRASFEKREVWAWEKA